MNYKNAGIFGDVAENAMKEFIKDNDIDIRTSIKLENIIDKLCSLEQDDTFDSVYKVGVTMLFKWVAYAVMDICNNEAIIKYRQYDPENTGKYIEYMFMDWDIGKVCETDPLLIAMDKGMANLATMGVEFEWLKYTIDSMLSFLQALSKFNFLKFDISKSKIDTGDIALNNHFNEFIIGESEPTFIDLYMLHAFSSGKWYDINSKTVESYKNIARCSLLNSSEKLDNFMVIFTQMLIHYTTFEKVQAECRGEDIRIVPESSMRFEIEKIVRLGDLYGKDLNNRIFVWKRRKTSTFNIPTVFTDEYLVKEHEFHMNDCKSYLMKDKNDERCGDAHEKE